MQSRLIVAGADPRRAITPALLESDDGGAARRALAREIARYDELIAIWD